MAAKSKRITFDDEGEVVITGTNADHKNSKKTKKLKRTEDDTEIETKKEETEEGDEYGEDDYFVKRDKLRLQQKDSEGDDEAQKSWYNVFPQYPLTEEVVDMKDNDQLEFFQLCKSSFQTELTSTFSKRNPADSRWLQTALQKGTAKDRANAGALLVTTNPLGNLEALSTLISFTKPSNKSCTEVIAIMTELWRDVLLPAQRKLLSLQMRGADWKLVRKDSTLGKERQRRVYAYWHFENELKDHYFEFLKNLQMCMQTGQDNAKSAAIVAGAQLLAYAPEKEQMLLTMLINKLGDPIPKIASKALHHLSNVAQKHPNMCVVIMAEAERLLFRNNIAERAQHFTLCFLASIAPAGRPEVCTKLVNICFALFKVLVQRGAVNNRTMQAILRCLQKAIAEAKSEDGGSELLSKDMQDTVYRLVHLADVRIAVQTLGLLLQLVSAQRTASADRFYNALYRKLLDMELVGIGTKTAAQLLHIVHRAVHIDALAQRARAFIKRLLQLALYMPAHMAAGCLIVVHKLLRSRKELLDASSAVTPVNDAALEKFDSGDETDATPGTAPHIQVQRNADAADDVVADTDGAKVRERTRTQYDGYHRVPAYAGAELALRNELLLLQEHFHPTVQVFAESIMNMKRLDYYGDPLRDFGLPYFLERFAFKNPKKLETSNEAEKPAAAHRPYVAYGGRGRPVRTLTAATCTEDEAYIFNFLEQKRQKAGVQKLKATHRDADEDEADVEGESLKAADVDDDEFEAYLDGFFSKKTAADAAGSDEEEEELDYLEQLGGELTGKRTDAQGKKQKKSAGMAEQESDDDYVDDLEGIDDDEAQFEGDDASDDELSSIEGEDGDDAGDSALSDENGEEHSGGDDDGEDNSGDDDDGEDDSGDDDDGEDDESEDDSGEDDDEEALMAPVSKKTRRNDFTERSFASKLKHSTDMNSLFAAADDFSELLEETGKTKGQGTANAIFNKDKSSEKQLRWEEKRRSNTKTYTKRGGSFGRKRKQ